MDGFQSNTNKNKSVKAGSGSTLVDPDELPESEVTMRVSREVDDEGLHLLYEYARLPPVNNSAEEEQETIRNDHPPRPTATPLQPVPSGSSSQPVPFAFEVDPPPEDEEGPFVQGDVGDTPISQRRTVRFRSRVRITSGIHSMSASSSLCGSSASSISVPLRGSGAYESKNMPGDAGATASLSEMLPSQAMNGWLNELAAASRERRRNIPSSHGSPMADDRSERTPLRSATRRMYTEPEEEDPDEEVERIRGGARKSEEQVMFGKWPWRLLKWQWWWWKLEPIVCCCDQFDDESDTD